MDIVRFRGGLGNQMFQYAFLKALALRGRKAMGSLGGYTHGCPAREFCLNNVFENVLMEIVDEEIFKELNERWREIKQDKISLKAFLNDYPNRFFWVEEPVGTYNEHVFETKNCVFVGYWQTEKYFNQIRKELLLDFQFTKGERMLNIWKEKFLAKNNYVSVHIRRGDYLDIVQKYGNICTKQYYEAAISYMNVVVKEPIFVFFSDDIEWVKEHYEFTNAVFIEANMFKSYQAWYDMCLMSCCLHHIIANSSFSWWGAWLNQKCEKIVVAPKLWENGQEMPDICPDNWIRL